MGSPSFSSVFCLIDLYEFFYASVIGPFNSIREETSRELTSVLMILHTFAADAFLVTGVTAIA
jgi:hypothetical protein